MKKILYSITTDLLKSKWLNLLMMLKLTAIIILISILSTNFTVSSDYLSAYTHSEGYGDAVFVTFEASTCRDIIDECGEDDIGVSSTYSKGATVSYIINGELSKFIKVGHSGEWFSGNIVDSFAEAIVSKDLEDKYKIDEIYTDIGVYSRPIKIIGYLDEQNTVISVGTSFGQGHYQDLFKAANFMICDKVDESSDITGFITNNNNAQHYIDNYNMSAVSINSLYSQYEKMTNEEKYSTFYYILLLFLVTFVCIVCNSVFNTEREIRRNVVKYVVGESNKTIVISEIIKFGVIYLIPFLINLLITIIANAQKNIVPFVIWKNFWISSALVLLVYFLCKVWEIIRIIKAKPLDELSKI